MHYSNYYYYYYAYYLFSHGAGVVSVEMGQAGIGLARFGGVGGRGSKDVLLCKGVPEVLLPFGVSIYC